MEEEEEDITKETNIVKKKVIQWARKNEQHNKGRVAGKMKISIYINTWMYNLSFKQLKSSERERCLWNFKFGTNDSDNEKQ